MSQMGYGASGIATGYVFMRRRLRRSRAGRFQVADPAERHVSGFPRTNKCPSRDRPVVGPTNRAKPSLAASALAFGQG